MTKKIVKFNIEFTKPSVNTERLVASDKQLQEITEQHSEPTAPHITEFRVLRSTLQTALSESEFVMADLYPMRKLYIQDKAHQMNDFSRSNLLRLSKVFDSVVSQGLRDTAKTLTKAEARELQEHITDLNSETGVFFHASEKVGDEWLPISLEEIAYIDDETAGIYAETGNEPYSGLNW